MDLFGIIFQNSFSQIALLSFSIILKISPRKSPIKFMSLNFKTASKTVSKITSKNNLGIMRPDAVLRTVRCGGETCTVRHS